MKKTFKTKLRLNSQIIRQMSLERITGGRPQETFQRSCDGDCPPPPAPTSPAAGCTAPRQCG